MDDVDREIVRKWSALTARGMEASPVEIANWMRLPVADVERRMLAMRPNGQVPS